MKQCQACVRELEEVIPGFFSLTLEEPYLAETARPGQFVHLRIGAGYHPLLRRPFSLAGACPQTASIRLLFRPVGEGTKLLSRVKKGDLLDCLGPLGSSFSTTAAEPAVLLAGGTGIAPLLFLAEKLLAEQRTVHLFYGAFGAPTLLPVKRFLSCGAVIHYVTEDGTAGEQGLLTTAFERALKKGLFPGQLFACGPRPFLAALAQVCRHRDYPLQVSLEERMACGIGACQGCAVLVRRGGEAAYLRVCREGPVFCSKEVIW